MENLVLAQVLVSGGVTEKMSKSTATKITNKAGVSKDENGFVSTEDVLAVLKANYVGTSSKFVETMAPVIAQIEEGTFEDSWSVPVPNAPKGPDAFVKAKAFDQVVALVKEGTEVTEEVIAGIVEELMA